MSAIRIKTAVRLVAAATATIVLLAGAGVARGAAPVKEVLSSHFGREVNLTQVMAKGGPALEDICTVESKDECQTGSPSSIAGGFEYAEAVAGAPNGNVYVADAGNARVQELTAAGEFILMFGKEVDKSTGEDVCTAASKDLCGAGVPGAAPGQLARPSSIAVDPASGDVYVLDAVNTRIEKFTAAGEFVLSIAGSPEHGPLTFDQGLHGNLLAVGGSDDLVYVGEREPGRVQEFESDGKWRGEVTGIGNVRAVAVDDSCALHEPVLTELTTPTCKVFDPLFGDLYVAYDDNKLIQAFTAGGALIGEPVTVGPAVSFIWTLATDPAGRLAVTAHEQANLAERQSGSLYDPASGRLITEFAISPRGNFGMGFNGNDELYATAAGADHEILAYAPEPVAELVTNNATCKEGAEHETNVTFDCALNGETNPYDVPETESWFEWGATCALGAKTPNQPVATVEELVPVSAPVGGLHPNESYCYQTVGVDQNVQLPEDLTGEKIVFKTPSLPPKVFGEPTASFVKSSSALMFGELNPEHALTEYYFEYAAGTEPAAKTLEECKPATTCTGVARTPVLKSGLYGKIGVTLEATGLQPSTTYHYRLTAVNQAGQSPPGAEGSFTTAPTPGPQASTGPPGAIGVSSATATGTVNPEGQAATYTFKLGVYNGASTQYGIVFSGSAAAVSAPIEESLALTGLQPGTTYAYKIAVTTGTGSAEGAPVTFTTTGLPSILSIPSVLPQIPVPNIAFPTPAVGPIAGTTTSRNAKKLAQALKACKKKPKSKQAACKQNAHKKYGSKQANHHKKKG
jgi:hypothetical protein